MVPHTQATSRKSDLFRMAIQRTQEGRDAGKWVEPPELEKR
jgi:hypothetical protein